MVNKIKYELQLIYSTKVQSQDGKRATWVDMARGVAIILVVMGHRGFITNTTNTWLSSFHLPLFFIASGILFAMKSEQDTLAGKFILRKIRSLIVPYFVFSICSMALDFHFVPAGPENLIPDFKLHLFQTVTLQGYSVLWFLPVTFLAELLLFGIHKRLDLKIVTLVTVPVSFIGYYMYRYVIVSLPALVQDMTRIVIKTFIATVFMVIGIWFWRIINNEKENAKKYNFLQLAIGVLLFSINIAVTWVIGLKDLNNLDLGFLSVYYALGITGSCGLFLICKNCINIAPLSFFGRNSLIVFCTHLNCYVLYYGTIFYMHFYKHYPLPDIVNENMTANVYTMFFTFMLEIPVILAINILLPFMIGQGYGFLKAKGEGYELGRK